MTSTPLFHLDQLQLVYRAQPALQDIALGRLTSACRSPQEYLERIRHAIQHPQERSALAARAHAEVLANETYESRFENLLKQLY